MKYILSRVCFVMILVSAGVYAKNINLYTEPKADSKVVATINPEHGVTIVYTPKTGGWMKVANPVNGEVGWVKSSDLGGSRYSMRMTTSSDGANQYSVYQFGTGNTEYQQQLESEMRFFEQRQRLMQQHIAHMFSDMFYFPAPIFIPVMIAPENHKPHQATPAKKAPDSPTAQPGNDKH